MRIEIESITGSIAIARKMLAMKIAAESFAWLSDVIQGVVMRVPEGRSAEPNRTCSVVVVLRDGQRFDSLAVADNVTDALELACHEARRNVAIAIGRPLRRRRQSGEEVPTIERRANEG